MGVYPCRYPILRVVDLAVQQTGIKADACGKNSDKAGAGWRLRQTDGVDPLSSRQPKPSRITSSGGRAACNRFRCSAAAGYRGSYSK